MASNKSPETNGLFTIHLNGLKPGISSDDLVPALQQLFSKKSREELRLLLEKVPLILTRQVPKEKAIKIKQFLESKGAMIVITENKSQAPVRDEKTAEGPKMEKSETAQVSPKAEQESTPEDRRRKPRIHKGIDIHPVSVVEIIDRSFKLLKEHFWCLFIILLIPQAFYFIVSKSAHIFLFQGAMVAPGAGMGIGIGILVFIVAILFLILQFWAQGALIFAVSERYLGHGASVGSSFAAIKSRLGRIVGTMVLMLFLLGLVMAVTGIVAALLIPALIAVGVNKILIGLIVAVLVIVAVFIFVRMFLNWLLVDKVVVIENIGWMKALHRSKNLMITNPEQGFWKKTKMKASLIILMGIVVAVAAALLFQIPGTFFTFLFKGNLVVTTILEVLNIAVNSIVTAFTAAAMILFYYDIRQRKEGFDLKMMAENL